MSKKEIKKPVQFDQEIHTSMSPVRRVWMVVMIFGVLGLTYVVYEMFEVGDFWVWLEDVILLFVILGLVFLAAALVVGLLLLYRKFKGNS